MATLQDVTTALQTLSGKVDTQAAAASVANQALLDEIARVESLIAAGGAVTPADLQTIVDNLGGISTKAQGVADQLTTIGAEAAGERPVPPVPAPVPAPPIPPGPPVPPVAGARPPFTKPGTVYPATNSGSGFSKK